MKKTMRQHAFISRLRSLAVVFGMALAFASCANEDVPQNPTKPNEDNDKNLTTFMAGGETRTSLNYNTSDFYWEKDDYIYVKDDDGVLQKSTNAPTSKVAAFKYKVPGKFTASSSYKVYYLGKNSDGTSVSISTAQSQTVPDNTEHFGTVGDYGTATATGTLGGGSFSFELEHQPAYLVFQPYTSNTVLHNCYLTKIEVTSDNDIAEKYTVNLTNNILDASAVANGKQIVLTTQDPTWGSSNYNGFPLTNSTANIATNGAYMVIKPGTHTLKIRYWVKEAATNIEGTITKLLPSKQYDSNTYYDMTANLNLRDYDGTKYYMWDARQNYWADHEWNSANPWQPTLDSQPANPNYPQSNSDSRWYHEGAGRGLRIDATQSCAGLPNANEITWYAKYGDPRWDADELWTTMGHLYKGGMWFKKKSVLKAEGHYNTEISADGTTDLRTTYGDYSNTSSSINTSGLPSTADASNYFYLPALGGYTFGRLYHIGSEGSYWSSSASPWNNSYDAYDLYFESGRVAVSNGSRYYGLRVGGFE